MTWLRAIQGVISRDKRVRLFYVMDKYLRPSRVFVATFRCAGDLQSVLKPACDKDCFALTAVCGKLCFLANLSVFVIWRGSPPGCLSSSLIFIWKTEPSRSAEWNSVLLALKSVSKISPANIILIHVRPAEIYCWNCNMLAFFSFFPPFWKDWIPTFANITFIVFVFFSNLLICGVVRWNLQPCIPPKEKPQEAVDPSKSTVDCLPPPTLT